MVASLSASAPDPATGEAGAAPTVLDGDTVRLADGQIVRLAAIDCPERGREGAEQATALVRDLLAGGAAPALDPPDPPRDRYGRLLADLVVDGRSVSDALLGAGLAWLYSSAAGERLSLQSAAVARRQGVFGDVDRIDARAYVVTRTRVHRPDCPFVPGRTKTTRGLAASLAAGFAPCRTCLPWPKATKW